MAQAGDPPELLELAAGSPGALLEQRAQWQALPEGLAERCSAFSGGDAAQTPLVALSLARDLCEALDVEQQLWLLNWWQLRLWRQRQDSVPLKRLEQLRGSCAATCNRAWPGRWRCCRFRRPCAGCRGPAAPVGPAPLDGLRWGALGSSQRRRRS